MFGEKAKRAARRALGGLTAVGLALAVSTGLEAQERQEMGKETVVVTQQQLQTALADPQVELDELGQFQGMKQGHVVIVEASAMVESEQELTTLRQDHGEAINAYRTAIEGNEIVVKALEKEELTGDDVLAVVVAEKARGEPSEEAEPRTGAHKTVYIVVSGRAETSSGSGE